MPRTALATAATVAALALAACGGPARSTGIGNTPPTSGDTLAAALARDVGAGAPVAIVPGKDGLRAVSADGARTRTLVAEPVPWALVDNGAGVVWFGSPDRTEIRMVDLEGPAAATPAVETIAAGLPAGVDPGGPEFAIAQDSPGDDIPVPLTYLEYNLSILPSVILVVGPEPGLSTEGGILEMWGQTEEFDKQVAAATLPGRDRVIEVARRAAARPPAASPAPPPADEKLRVDGIDPAACDDDAELCGSAERVPGTQLWRTVVSYACGDGCYTEWRLYDPAKRELLKQDWAGWIYGAWVAPDGSAFVRDGVIVRFDSGPVAATPAPGEDEAGPSGGGWLGGGTYLGR